MIESENDVRQKRTIWGIIQSWQSSKIVGVFETQGFLAATRNLLESQNIKADFPLLQTYCDWMFHPQLDRSSHRHMMTRALTWLNDPDEASMVDRAANQVFGVQDLFTELGRFISGSEVDELTLDHLFPRNIRTQIVSCIFSAVEHRPIVMPKNYLKEDGRIDEKKANRDFGPTRLGHPKQVSVFIEERSFMGCVLIDSKQANAMIKLVFPLWPKV